MDESEQSGDRDEYIRRLGEVSHLFTDAGLILITTVSDMDDYELDAIDTLNQPNDLLIVNVGASRFNHRKVDLEVSEETDPKAAVAQVKELLHNRNYLIEYYL